jgi:choline monooxygenase
MFIGHKSDVELNGWKVLPQTNNTKTLCQDTTGYFIQSNICTHQGSLIRNGHGRGNPVCPYHAMSWDFKGNPKGNGTVGHHGGAYCKNDTPLWNDSVYDWEGFLFTSPVNFPTAGVDGNYRLEEYRVDMIKSDPTPSMDLFLDVDHIPIVHPELYNQINVPSVADVQWAFDRDSSIQYVPFDNSDNQWGDLLEVEPMWGAVWLAVYPNVMFEWQPGAVFVMQVEAVSDGLSKCHVWKYKDLNHSEEVWHTSERVWELAWSQDKAQAEKLQHGYKNVLWEKLERSKQHYRHWLDGTKIHSS